MNLPTFNESEAAINSGQATALHRFIYDNTPAGGFEEKEFREALKEVLIENELKATANQEEGEV